MTDWESRYLAGDMPWEKGSAAPPLLELLAKRGVAMWGTGVVLVPGCGLGHDVRVLAELGLDVTGVDISRSAVERAEDFPVLGKESYEVGDFLEPAWRDERQFSAIWEHTCFCAIDPSRRGDYAAAAAACLEDGGVLAGVFFLTPHDPGEEEEGPPFATTIEEIDACFAPYLERVDAWVPSAAYPGREGREWIAVFQKRAQA
ncbi:MAG: methyltransferase domain-containing protein [Verrucomicrobiota bacterium]